MRKTEYLNLKKRLEAAGNRLEAWHNANSSWQVSNDGLNEISSIREEIKVINAIMDAEIKSGA